MNMMMIHEMMVMHEYDGCMWSYILLWMIHEYDGDACYDADALI